MRSCLLLFNLEKLAVKSPHRNKILLYKSFSSTRGPTEHRHNFRRKLIQQWWPILTIKTTVTTPTPVFILSDWNFAWKMSALVARFFFFFKLFKPIYVNLIQIRFDLLYRFASAYCLASSVPMLLRINETRMCQTRASSRRLSSTKISGVRFPHPPHARPLFSNFKCIVFHKEMFLVKMLINQIFHRTYEKFWNLFVSLKLIMNKFFENVWVWRGPRKTSSSYCLILCGNLNQIILKNNKRPC